MLLAISVHCSFLQQNHRVFFLNSQKSFLKIDERDVTRKITISRHSVVVRSISIIFCTVHWRPKVLLTRGAVARRRGWLWWGDGPSVVIWPLKCADAQYRWWDGWDDVHDFLFHCTSCSYSETWEFLVMVKSKQSFHCDSDQTFNDCLMMFYDSVRDINTWAGKGNILSLI